MKTCNLIVIIIMGLWITCFGQDDSYRIGKNDVLSIGFWQEPDLNSEVRVGEDSKITLPVIGDLTVEGLTTSNLAKLIVEQISFYNPGISQATVVVIEYNSQTIALTGAVNNPGEYHFERIPNLLDVIRQAGGALPEADLSSVTIIRQENEKINLIKVDLLKHFHNGSLADLPKLMAKDLIDVPLSPYEGVQELYGRQAFKGKNVYFIYGAVNEPGAKTLSEDIELVDAIAAAGGTTPEADIKNVRVVLKDVRYSSVLNFDLHKYTESGRPMRYRLHPEDTIIIPFRQEDTFWSRLPEIVVPAVVSAIVTTVATTILVNALADDNTAAAE
ncbi:MAG: polysaccharide biosynthesis/export family protein [candidate division Zixibacteria bacterium]|nr:polysaccharide biosynthesis/export family protein [candidate division Zixibacteria bacterium]